MTYNLTFHTGQIRTGMEGADERGKAGFFFPEKGSEWYPGERLYNQVISEILVVGK